VGAAGPAQPSGRMPLQPPPPGSGAADRAAAERRGARCADVPAVDPPGPARAGW